MAVEELDLRVYVTPTPSQGDAIVYTSSNVDIPVGEIGVTVNEAFYNTTKGCFVITLYGNGTSGSATISLEDGYSGNVMATFTAIIGSN
jgi:hypothetical protein